jgi:hypothetical protein
MAAVRREYQHTKQKQVKVTKSTARVKQPFHKIHIDIYPTVICYRIIRSLFIESLNIERCSDFIFRHIFKEITDGKKGVA